MSKSELPQRSHNHILPNCDYAKIRLFVTKVHFYQTLHHQHYEMSLTDIEYNVIIMTQKTKIIYEPKSGMPDYCTSLNNNSEPVMTDNEDV